MIAQLLVVGAALAMPADSGPGSGFWLLFT
jgi:hypothetical protein